MDYSKQSTQGGEESTDIDPTPIAQQKNGTVMDVRAPSVDPKDLPEEVREILEKLNPLKRRRQEGRLKDNSDGVEKRFTGSCAEDLKEGQIVTYVDLPNNPHFEATVIC